jgi:hypothetical protein
MDQPLVPRRSLRHLAAGAGAMVLVLAVWGITALFDQGDEQVDERPEPDAGVSVPFVGAGAGPTDPPLPVKQEPSGEDRPPAEQKPLIEVKPPAAEEPTAKKEPNRPKGKKRRKNRHKVARRPKTPPARTDTQPAQGSGWLNVRSRPKTEVWVDATRYGSTPLDKTIAMNTGVHVVKLVNTKAGIDYQQRLEIKAGKRHEIDKTFRKGYLKVFVKPFGHVYIDDAYKGITPLEKIALYEGFHELRITCNRTGRTKTKRVHIDPGMTKTVEMDLR